MKVKLGSVGKLHRRPESEPFFRLAETAKQAMLVLSSMQPDADRRRKGRSKPDRVFRQSLESKTSHAIAIARLLTMLLPVVTCGPQVASVSAHENTRAAYVHSLGSATAALPAASLEGFSCSLTLNLVDATTLEPVSGLVRITTADGSVQTPAGLLSRGTGLPPSHASRDWSVVLGSAILSVPRGRLTIEALSGLETEMTRRTVDVTEESSMDLTLPLVRFHRAAKNGWRCGNTHLHLRSLTREQADQYLSSVSRADGLELVFVSYLSRADDDRTYISNTYTAHQLQRLSGDGVLFDFGEEHRHNFGPYGEGYGHVMFLNLKELIRPVSIGPGIMGAGPDWPPMRRGIDQARHAGATVIWCHNTFGLEAVPDWIGGVLHAHNIFDGGNHGSYEDTFYRFMDIGLRVPFSTGTDWFIYDFSRVYVKVEEPLGVARWLDGLKKGRTFITNGPLLEFSLGAHHPGDVVQLAAPGQLDVSAHGVGRCDFQALEVVYNGRVVQSAPSRPVGGHFEAEINTPLRISAPGWVALRVKSEGTNELGAPLFGHTSAVYVEMAGKSSFKPAVARELIADMNEAMHTIREKANFANDKQAEEILNLYREGIARLGKRLQKQ